MKNNKWLIGLVVLLVIVFIFIMMGSSAPAPATTNAVNTVTTTSSTVVKNSPKTSVPTGVATEKTSVANTSGGYVVYYTNSGFSPKQIQVPAGHLFKFINNSNKALLITVDDVSLPNELNQSNSIGRGGVYTYNFTRTGTWSFHNADFPSDHGSIVVY